MSFDISMAVVPDTRSAYDVVFDNAGPSNQVLYEGTSYPGISDKSGINQWRIRKFYYDANGLLKGWRWANSSVNFDKDWTQRSTYTYDPL